MKTWTRSAIRSYYLDPVILFLGIGAGGQGRPPIVRAGYYVSPHCDPDCCQAMGGVSQLHLGPFPSAAAAREWSARNLAATD
jgi:hypothetical protein